MSGNSSAQVEQANLYNQSIHYGYYLLGRGFVGLLPFDTDLAMNVGCALVGLAGVALVFLLVWWQVHDAWLADRASRQPLLTNVFNAEIYLPSLMLDHYRGARQKNDPMETASNTPATVMPTPASMTMIPSCWAFTGSARSTSYWR